ncbi:MAG TPA: efflux RND transporter permease subunit [Candidatus Hydrogenedentes bacterium]|nr:efflux RND transporter permease subunit [Candidatus Hydrogenedentota bacterium]
MRFSLPKFSLRHPITVLMLSLSTVALGVIAWNRMPLNFLPRVDRPFIGVFIAYPGASPAQVEQQIAVPVEGELRTIPGVRRIRTTSTSAGCEVGLLFSLDTDMSIATADVRDRLERLKLVLPAEADKMLIQRFSSGSIPIMAFGMFREGDKEKFDHLARTVVEPRLSRVEGVAQVEILSPVQPREVLIEFNQDTLRSLNLNLPQVLQAVRESSFNLSVGELPEGTRKHYARVIGEYRRIEDIGAIVVGPGGMRLKDVAEVNYRSREEKQQVSLDGADGLAILVIKDSEANTVSTCERVRAELDSILQEPAFDGATSLIFFDQSDLINRALKNLFLQGFYGSLMAIGVLFFFLHRVIPTLVVAFAIPSSLLIAVVFMFFTGMSLNIITMVSMIIAVGMLVDNAIVVVENTIRHRDLGASMADAAVDGAAEVGMAIFASTLTTIVVFIPMYFMETGRMSVFMQQLGGPLIASLSGSLLMAVTVVPLVMSRLRISRNQNVFQTVSSRYWRTHASDAPPAGAVGGMMHRIGRLHPIQWVIGVYGGVVRAALRQRVLCLLLLGAGIYVTYAFPMQHVGMRPMPKLDTREVRIDARMEQNYNLDMAKDLMSRIEAQIDPLRETLAIKKVLKLHGADEGFIEVYLYTEDDGPIGENPPFTTEEVMQILSEKIPKQVPGAELRFSMADAGQSEEGETVSLFLRGEDGQILTQYAEQLKAVLGTIEEISDPETNVEPEVQEVQVRIDKDLAQQAGVSPMIVAQTVDAALRGTRMPYLKQGRREVSVWAQFREEDRKSQANLENVAVPGLTGQLVPLQRLTDYSKEASPTSIRRINGKNVIALSAKLNTKNLSAVRAKLESAVEDLGLPPGYTVDFGEELEDLESNIFNFSTTLAMAVILIYIVMASLFESYLLPLSILTTVPISLFGAVWMLFYMDSQFDQLVLIGCILMAGVIVNNGIVIVDHINRLYRERGDRTEAIVQAGVDRFRPVMMTALTTILGLVPLAMAKTGGASTFAGLGQALIGGLTIGTILTLVVVPVFFTLLDDFQRWSVDFFGNLAGRRLDPPKGADEAGGGS